MAAAPPDGCLASAERAVRLAASDPAAARALAHAVLLNAPPPPGRADAVPAPEAAAVAHRALALAARELGDLPLAEEHLRRSAEIADAGGMPHRVAQARLSLVPLRTELGHPRQALAIAAEAEPYLTPIEAAMLGVNQAGALIRLGRHGEAVRRCDHAARVLGEAVRHSDRHDDRHSGHPGGHIGERRGDRRPGRHRDRAAGVSGEETTFLAGALLNRGIARVYLREFTAAEDDLTRSAELARAEGLEHTLALAEGNLPFLAARRGDLPAAFAAYRRAEQTLFGCPERLATVRCDLAEALVAAHLPGEARVLLDLAVPELEAAGAGAALTEARLALAEVELRTGDPRRAREVAELARSELLAQGRESTVPRATEIILRARLKLGLPGAPSPYRAGPAADGETRDVFTGATRTGSASADAPTGGLLLSEMLACAADLDGAGHPSGPLRLTAAELALRLGDDRAAGEQLALLASAGSGVVTRHATALRRALAGDRRGAFAAVRAGLAEVGAGTTGLEDPMVRAHAVRAGEPLAALGLALSMETGRAQAVLAWAERWRAVARGAGRPAAPVLAELQAALGDTALVEFVRHGNELVAVAVTPGRVALHRLGPVAPVAEAVVRLRYGLRRAHLRDGRAPGTAVEAASLERLVLGPLLPRLGDRPLVIVPCGTLHALPWPVLPANADRPVTVAASAADWLSAHRAGAGPAPGDGTPARTGSVVVAGPGLRYAEAEADMVAEHWPGARRIPATRPAVTAALERAKTAHLAAHGTFCAHSPLLSGIDLDDGRLMAYDLLRLSTPPDLVVLSACDAGMARAPADGAPLGLAGTFLSRGTRCVVAGLVPVRDAETLTLMTAFHGLLAAGHPPAPALTLASGKTGVAGFACFGYGDQPVATGREGSATQWDQDPT
ncbi:CHAT domain-containing protein [Planomonospora sp. ID67723]|uniref:CHAT domain-containing protein n=1 Tax=Planomonospora sp. ID67723 TaxID=2738134 RepID=UPI0018C3526C|nr:CHAT domain-containing protein [Planomonospora sp. ID67723]MBG0830617.1 CHAT domain-containing protein [Planomonospora sp. ID67723]